MTRDEIERDYHTVKGVIVSPGKFEACPVYAPYFWDRCLDGDGEWADDTTWFDIDNEDTALFPELHHFARVGVWEDGNGFIYCCHEERNGELAVS